MITFRVIVYRDKFSSKNIKSKSFFLVKKIASNNIPNIGVGKRVKNCIDNKDVIQLVIGFNDTMLEV